MQQDLVLDTRLESVKNLAWWLYMGHAISFVFSLGAFSFVPLIINYLKRDDAAGTFVHSHHSWMIRSFWWYLFWMTIGVLLALTVVGLLLAVPVWVVAWIWKAYRLLKGFLDLNENKAMPV
jgi:uncharacterized membrane protein